MLGIIKGDLRYEYINEKMECVISKDLADFFNIDYLLLPFSGIDSYYNIKQTNLNLLDILKENDIKIIFVGIANDKLISLCKDKGIMLVELLKDDYFVIENARLTAMGIIDYLHRKKKAISDECIFIIGYGNISYCLAKLLSIYKVNFAIYSPDKVEQKFIKLEGYSCSDIVEASKYSIIINTIPCNYAGDYSIFKDKYILDVASAPYGFDISKLELETKKYEIYSSIPSKFVPDTAGNLVYKIIQKYLQKFGI